MPDSHHVCDLSLNQDIDLVVLEVWLKVLLVSVSDDMYAASTVPEHLVLMGMDVVHVSSESNDCLASRTLNAACAVVHDSSFIPVTKVQQSCELLRQSSPALPLLILTDRVCQEDIESLFDCGVDDFLAWPQGTRVLRHRITDVIRRKQLEFSTPVECFASQRACAWDTVQERDLYRCRPPEASPISGKNLSNALQISPGVNLESSFHEALCRLQLIYEAIPDVLFEVSQDGVFCEQYGNLRASVSMDAGQGLIGKSMGDVFPTEQARRLQSAISSACTQQSSEIVHYRLEGQSKSQYFEARVVPLQTGRALLMVRNVTETMLAEKELRESERRFRTLVANLPGAVYRYTLKGGKWEPVFVSDAIETVSGHSSESVMTGAISPFDVISHEDKDRVRRIILEAIENQQRYVVDYRIHHTDGNLHWVNETGRASYDESGAPIYLDGVLFDVTPLKQMEEQLVRKSQMAAVGTLASGIAHEVNNPLAVVMANLEYGHDELEALVLEPANEQDVVRTVYDVLKLLEKVKVGVERVQTIVQDLRVFSDAAEQQSGPVELHKAMDWALYKVMHTLKSRAQLVCDFQEVPPVWGNEAGLVQVFIHLLINAMHSFQCDDISANTISVSIYQHSNDKVHVDIQDTGKGMAPELIRDIFKPFFSTRPVGHGVGLGLSVCHGIVDALGGEIIVKSTLGKGSLFRIVMPSMNLPVL